MIIATIVRPKRKTAEKEKTIKVVKIQLQNVTTVSHRARTLIQSLENENRELIECINAFMKAYKKPNYGGNEEDTLDRISSALDEFENLLNDLGWN